MFFSFRICFPAIFTGSKQALAQEVHVFSENDKVGNQW